ncbi:MAG: CRISPR-associated endoribonuclease Cas6 [Candidatus Brocadiaceae bacterium]|nr:CRISPR-associated endoribonuclease Cas6 [Candidatus Brocadiaceae bacterium]
MRIKITLASNSSGSIDCNYQHQIQAVIYGFLARSNPDYAAWLHEQGYLYKKEQRFKLFVFSGITFHGSIKIRKSNDSNSFSFHGSSRNPFLMSFQIASPVDKFIQGLIEGIFQEGQETRLGTQIFSVYQVETLPNPFDCLNSLNGSSGLDSLNCLNGLDRLNGLNGSNSSLYLNLQPLESPLFIKKPMPAGVQDLYLFPGDDGYEAYVNRNLLNKYETLYGQSYTGDVLTFHFHEKQGKSVKQFTIFKKGKSGNLLPVHIKGTLQPFTVKGPGVLIKIGLECGFGQNNSMGCGYVGLAQTDRTV